MASSSEAATCNGGDVSSAASEDEEATWIRLLQLERDIEADRAETQPYEERLILLATSFEGASASFKSVDFETSNSLLRWLEGQQETSMISSPRICFFLSNLLVSDRQRNWESRFLKLFWRHSNGISDADLLLFLSKLAEHYSPSQEVENLEDFMLTNEERAKFLHDCSTLDKATCHLAKDFNEYSLRHTQGRKPKYWTRRDHTLHSVSSSESVKPLEAIFPFSTRFETAKKCLDRLDLLKSYTVDIHPDESDTLASVVSSFKSPELQALHALKKEMELHGEVVLQLEQLIGQHLHAYEELSKDQLERSDEFFRTCQEEKRNVVQEALYKKVKCLASIKKASIDRQVKLSSEALLKGIVQKAKSAFKETSDVLYFETLDLPIPELQGLKTLKIAYHNAKTEEVSVHNMRLPKQSTVGDLISELKTKVELSRPKAELRILEIFYHKIYKIFPLNEKIANINDQYWTLRAEEIPDEEKELGVQGRLIHVYHFLRDPEQNQMVINFGEPFFLVVRENETLAEVKVRVQNKLQVSDGEFSIYKFAFLSLGRPEYLQDDDVVASCFQKKDTYGPWEYYLGLEHSDTTPKRAHQTNQVCDNVKKRVKTYN